MLTTLIGFWSQRATDIPTGSSKYICAFKGVGVGLVSLSFSISDSAPLPDTCSHDLDHHTWTRSAFPSLLLDKMIAQSTSIGWSVKQGSKLVKARYHHRQWYSDCRRTSLISADVLSPRGWRQMTCQCTLGESVPETRSVCVCRAFSSYFVGETSVVD